MSGETEHIGADIGAPEDADEAIVGEAIIASMLQSFPTAFEEEAMLRVHQFRLTRAIAEEGRVKVLDIVEDRARLHIVGITNLRQFHARRQQLFFGKEGDGFHAIAQVLPELFEGIGAREATSHADDRDPLATDLLTSL